MSTVHMVYNFDALTQRRHSGSMKWDSAADDDVLPLWVADMDFEVAPCIVDALRRRVEHTIFGYTLLDDSYYSSIINWFARRHAFTIRQEWIQAVPGVVAGLSCVIKALTHPGEGVLLLTPAFNCFFSSVRNNGCRAELSPLRAVGDSYVIDYADLEARAAKEDVTLCIVCNPHNPVGRVWREDELLRVRDICQRHNVIIVSDEIHGEVVMPQYKYIPFATLCRDGLLTLTSPTKGFNIAGLQIANIICPNALWRQKIDRAINDNEVCDLNPFGIVALQAAYNDGAAWLDAMCAYVYDNYLALKAFVARALPALTVCRLEGTYLAWVDVAALGIPAAALAQRLKDEGKVWVSDGQMYGDTAPQQHLRINIACPRQRLMEALRRMEQVIKTL